MITVRADRARTEQIAFRLDPAERAALGQLLQLRGKETGDASVSGFFRAFIRREAAVRGVPIGEPSPSRSVDHESPLR